MRSNKDTRVITFDFNKEDWSGKLKENGFDANKKTLFLWEGVTYYLPEETIKQNIGAMNMLLSEESIVSFDFFTKQWLFENNAFVMKYAESALKVAGEPFQFGFDGISEDAAMQQIECEFLVNSDFEIKRFERLGKYETNFIGGFIELSK